MTSGVYLILGTPGAGRRKIVFDLIEGGLPTDAEVDVYLPAAEGEHALDEQLSALPQAELFTWSGSPGEAPSPGQASICFFLFDGQGDFREQLIAFKAWQSRYHLPVQRIISVIDCTLAEAHPELEPWFEAVIHFSDAVLLNRREHVSNKWIRQFEFGYHKRHFPCMFAFVKKSKVDNPALLLHPEPRRVSHFFDESDPIEDLELDEDNLPEEPIDIIAKTDPYLVRLPSGAFEVKLPQPADYLK
ncbi:MAG: hypothetical protein AAGF10_06115 [Verrucomicrobiota bacterium]